MERILLSSVGIAVLAISLIPLTNNSVTQFRCNGTPDFCNGYNVGAATADTDNDNGIVSLSQHRCHGNVQYCEGFVKGYDDEAAHLQ